MLNPVDMSRISGLTQSQAQQRLTEEGYNELPHSNCRNSFTIALEVIREPMFLLLVACGVIYLLLGEPKEALMLLGFVFVVMGITIVQERRTERALEALRDLTSPRALVIRNGQQQRIPGREVARGDILILAEGDRVPADAILRHSINVSADESLLTGESLVVRKVASKDSQILSKPGGDDLSSVFSGTLITQGQGIAEVVAAGMHTEIGKIGKALQSLESEQTLLQKETSRLVRKMALVGLSFCAVVVIVYALMRGNTIQVWKEGFLAGIATAMATLPEELPVVLTIFLALGAWRISQKQVLTRRIPAIETLGAATVLCVDKTGTLTQNRMSISKIFAGNRLLDASKPKENTLPEDFHRLVEFGILASKKDPFDPMEKALRELGITHLAKTEHLHENWNLVQEYPLSPDLLALSHVWRSPDGQELMIACKGAPEAVADLCHLSDEEMNSVLEKATSMAKEGLRVLGVGQGLPMPQTDLPQKQHDFEFTFLGLIGLADPIRPTVPQAIQECYTAGIRVVMITGDYPVTAQTIARQIGLNSVDQVVTGPELDHMNDEQLKERLAATNIIARVVPEQKLRIVNALKAAGEIVAMTGDGVNDAPALKAAHIGIAMGGRGTDVAREAAGLVLLDDDFSSIVQAVRLGRRIFDNIKKAISYIFAIHVPVAGLSLIPVFFSDWKLILLPVHIVFLELVIDPSCTLIFEAENAEADIMTRPPRNPRERLFSLKSLSISILLGLSVLAIVMGVFLVTRAMGHQENNARGLTFATLVVANLALILANRSWSRTILSMMKEPNKALWWILIGTVILLGLVLYVPSLRDLFHFAPLHGKDLVISLIVGGVSIMWFEGLKLLRQKKWKTIPKRN